MYAKKYILFIVFLLILSSCGSTEVSPNQEDNKSVNSNKTSEDNFDETANVPAEVLNFTCSSNVDLTAGWSKLNGPIGGIGYNIRYTFANPEVMYVTDVWTGIQKSVDGGRNWSTSNGTIESGIDFRTGPTLDEIPVFALRINPVNENIVWVGLTESAGLYVSKDSGTTWESKKEGLSIPLNPDYFYFEDEEDSEDFQPSFDVRMIEINPNNENEMYVMGDYETGYDGYNFSIVRGFVFKSTDGGESFRLTGDFPTTTRWLFFLDNEGKELLLTTGIFDREPDTIDENTDESPSESFKPSGLGSGVYKSYDGGLTWSQSNSGMSDSLSLQFGGGDQSPFDKNLIIIASGNDVDNGLREFGGAIYRSEDGGESWSDVSPYDGLSILGAVAFSESDPNIVYVAGENDFFRSSDAGKTWESKRQNSDKSWGPPGIKPGNPIDMVVSADDPDVVFINNYGGGVFKTSDGGNSWEDMSKGYTGANILGLTTNQDGCIAANGRSQVHISDDSGKTWNGILYGSAYRNIGDGSVVKFLTSDSTGKTLLAADMNNGQILITTDFGSNWSQVEGLQTLENSLFNDEEYGVVEIAEAPSDPNIIYTGFITPKIKGIDPHAIDEISDTPGLYKSVDAGRTWFSINNGIPKEPDSMNITDIAVSYQNPDLVYATTLKDGLYRSLDGGETWEQLLGVLPEGMEWEECGHTCVNDEGEMIDMEDLDESEVILRKYLMSIAVDPNNDSIIYLGTNVHGVLKSTDGGESWKETLWESTSLESSKRMHAHAIDIEINPKNSNIVAIADWNSGVLISFDSGESWERVVDGLGTGVVNVLEFSQDGKVLYLGTSGDGVYRYIIEN